MTAVCAGVDDIVRRNLEILGQLVAQTCAVEAGEGCYAGGFHARVEQRDKTCDVSRVEDNDDVLYIGAVFAHVLSEVLGDLRVAAEKILAGHACLAGSATRGYDIFRSGESFLDVIGESDVHVLESALQKFFCNAFKSLCVWIIEANVGCEVHHERCLRHVRSDHAGRTNDKKLFVC